MSITYEDELNQYLLAKACNEKEKNKLLSAYEEMQGNIQQNGLKNKFGLVSIEEATLSAQTYYSISKAICRLEDKVIIDCGCGQALQQVFFSKAKRYIGIDVNDTFFKISDNAVLIKGNVVDILPKLSINNETIGISILCGMCFEDVNKAMKKYFTELIII